MDEATKQESERLYAWWLDMLPAFFAGFASKTAGGDGGAGAPAANGTAHPYPVGPMLEAMASTRQWVQPIFSALFQGMTLNQPGTAFNAFEQLVQGGMGSMTDRLTAMSEASSHQPDVAGLGAGWLTAPVAAFAQTLKPLPLNLERAYGGLADAFGLAGSRELQQALREMAVAALAHRQAQTEYLGLVAGALGKGSDALMKQLAEMGGRGESVDSVLSLLRLWARTSDGAMHAAMQSPAALEASARLLRTATRSREQQHRVVAIASESLNVPTRAEVDEAYREIQELKRELRRLRQAIAPAQTAGVPALAAPAAAPIASARPTRVRKPASPKPSAQRKTTAKRSAPKTARKATPR